MSDQPESLILVYLRRLDANVDWLREAIADLKQRMTALEIQVSQHIATVASHYASVAIRLDRIEQSLDRLERHPDIVPA